MNFEFLWFIFLSICLVKFCYPCGIFSLYVGGCLGGKTLTMHDYWCIYVHVFSSVLCCLLLVPFPIDFLNHKKFRLISPSANVHWHFPSCLLSNLFYFTFFLPSLLNKWSSFKLLCDIFGHSPCPFPFPPDIPTKPPYYPENRVFYPQVWTVLGSANLIGDGFFDCGRLVQGTAVKSLTNHLEEDMQLFKHVDADRVLRCKASSLCAWGVITTFP